MRHPGFLHTRWHPLDRLDPTDRYEADRLDAWLNGQMAHIGNLGDGDVTIAPIEPGLAAVATHVQTLAARADAQDEQLAGDRTRQRIWEEIMAHQPTTGRAAPGVPTTRPQTARPVRFRAPRLRRAATRWSPAFNVAMVLVLLTALVAGVAGYYGHHAGSSGPTQPARLAAIASPARVASTPAPAETPVPTTQGAPAPAETFGGAIPTPDECTVKPLTIDEVMARLGYQPLTAEEQQATRDAAATRITEFDPNAGLPGPGTPMPVSTYTPTAVPQREPTQQEMDGIIAAHRQLIACIIKRSPLQIWAMIDPDNRYWREVAQFAAPPFSDPTILRMKIEGFVAGKQWLFPDPTQMLPPLSFETPLVDPNPADASVFHTPDYVNDSLVAHVSVYYYSPDNPGASPYYTSQMASYGRGDSNLWTYRYDPALKHWLLLDRPGGFSQQG